MASLKETIRLAREEIDGVQTDSTDNINGGIDVVEQIHVEEDRALLNQVSQQIEQHKEAIDEISQVQSDLHEQALEDQNIIQQVEGGEITESQVTPEQVQASQEALKIAMVRLGMNIKDRSSFISHEDINNNTYSSLKLSNEGIKELADKAWELLKKFFQSIGKLLRQFWNFITSCFRNTGKKLSGLINRIKIAATTNGDDLCISRKRIEEARVKKAANKNRINNNDDVYREMINKVIESFTPAVLAVLDGKLRNIRKPSLIKTRFGESEAGLNYLYYIKATVSGFNETIKETSKYIKELIEKLDAASSDDELLEIIEKHRSGIKTEGKTPILHSAYYSPFRAIRAVLNSVDRDGEKMSYYTDRVLHGDYDFGYFRDSELTLLNLRKSEEIKDYFTINFTLRFDGLYDVKDDSDLDKTDIPLITLNEANSILIFLEKTMKNNGVFDLDKYTKDYINAVEKIANTINEFDSKLIRKFHDGTLARHKKKYVDSLGMEVKYPEEPFYTLRFARKCIEATKYYVESCLANFNALINGFSKLVDYSSGYIPSDFGYMNE